MMPWARTDWMTERVKFIAAYLQHEARFSDLCLDFGISRKTGYKWVRRYEAGGAAALGELSRAPHAHPNAVPSGIVESILAIRRRHPRWGPRKVQVILRRQRPRITLPAASTIGDILKRNGLVRPRPTRAPQLALWRPTPPVRCTERGLVRGLQGSLPSGRSALKHTLSTRMG
jgi:transposase-like protein